MKVCSKCKIKKPNSAFDKDRYHSSNLTSQCKGCRSNSKIQQKYGLSNERYEKIKAKQDDCCAICKVEPPDKLCVDHDHLTGKVRGLLCHRCNRSLGSFNDDIDLLKQSIKYLRKHKK